MKTALIAAAAKPSSERRSGTRTVSVPNISAGSATSQRLPRILEWCSAAQRYEIGWRSPFGGVAVSRAAIATPIATKPTAVKTGPVPSTDAMAPRTGPSRAPAIATANTVPIS